MTFRVSWQAPAGLRGADFLTEYAAERFAADKVASGVSHVVVFEVDE